MSIKNDHIRNKLLSAIIFFPIFIRLIPVFLGLNPFDKFHLKQELFPWNKNNPTVVINEKTLQIDSKVRSENFVQKTLNTNFHSDTLAKLLVKAYLNAFGDETLQPKIRQIAQKHQCYATISSCFYNHNQNQPVGVQATSSPIANYGNPRAVLPSKRLVQTGSIKKVKIGISTETVQKARAGLIIPKSKILATGIVRDLDVTAMAWDGLYCITIQSPSGYNTFAYFGESGIADSTTCIATRFLGHLNALVAGTHKNTFLQQAFNQNPNSYKFHLVEAGPHFRVRPVLLAAERQITRDGEIAQPNVPIGNIVSPNTYLVNQKNMRQPMTQSRFNELMASQGP